VSNTNIEQVLAAAYPGESIDHLLTSIQSALRDESSESVKTAIYYLITMAEVGDD
jgi:thiamine pyrophosphokinase